MYIENEKLFVKSIMQSIESSPRLLYHIPPFRGTLYMFIAYQKFIGPNHANVIDGLSFKRVISHAIVYARCKRFKRCIIELFASYNKCNSSKIH